jgi:hypothetical protein
MRRSLKTPITDRSNHINTFKQYNQDNNFKFLLERSCRMHLFIKKQTYNTDEKTLYILLLTLSTVGFSQVKDISFKKLHPY